MRPTYKQLKKREKVTKNVVRKYGEAEFEELIKDKDILCSKIYNALKSNEFITADMFFKWNNAITEIERIKKEIKTKTLKNG